MCGMALTSEDQARHLRKLAALVTQRRVALGISSKLKAADHCGLADYTYRKIEKGEPVSDSSYAQLDVGFGFRAGSSVAVAEGRSDSIVLEDGTELIEGGQIARLDTDALAQDLPDAVTKSAMLVAPELTGVQMKALSEEIMEELRRRGILPSRS
jgi:hypothetical protein